MSNLYTGRLRKISGSGKVEDVAFRRNLDMIRSSMHHSPCTQLLLGGANDLEVACTLKSSAVNALMVSALFHYCVMTVGFSM